MSTTGADVLVEIGRLGRIHGVRGEIRARLHNPQSTLLHDVDRVALVGTGGAVEWRRIAATRPHKHLVLVRFTEVDSADRAQMLVGRTIAVPRSALPEIGDNEYYHVDLIGCRVESDDGRYLGDIAEVMTTASNDICVVRKPGGETLVPLIDDVVLRVSVRERSVLVRAIPGLLEAEE